MRAVDNRESGIQKSDIATVTITVLRDSFAPEFLNEPYRVASTLSERNTAVGTIIYNVSARDRDLQVSGHL